MAIPSNPGRIRIFNEFGVNTRNAAITNGSLAQMWDIFSGGSPAAHSRHHFSGYGQPEGSTITPQSIGSEGINASLNLSFLGSVDSAFYYFQYWEGHTAPNGVQETTPIEVGTTGDKNNLITNLTPSTDYSIRGVIYNLFNSHSFDHKTLNTIQVTTEAPAITVPTPNLQSVTYVGQNALGTYDYKFTWTLSNGLDYTYDGQRYMNSSWGGPGAIRNVVQISYNTYEGLCAFSSLSFGATYRMRAKQSGVDGSWSNIV